MLSTVTLRPLGSSSAPRALCAPRSSLRSNRNLVIYPRVPKGECLHVARKQGEWRTSEAMKYCLFDRRGQLLHIAVEPPAYGGCPSWPNVCWAIPEQQGASFGLRQHRLGGLKVPSRRVVLNAV